jgi:hypothetical protein
MRSHAVESRHISEGRDVPLLGEAPCASRASSCFVRRVGPWEVSP